MRPLFKQPYLFNGDQLDTSRFSLMAKSQAVAEQRRGSRPNSYDRLRASMESQFGERTEADQAVSQEIALGRFNYMRLVDSLLYVVHNPTEIVDRQLRTYQQKAALSLVMSVGGGEPLAYEPEAVQAQFSQSVGRFTTRAIVLLAELPRHDATFEHAIELDANQ